MVKYTMCVYWLFSFVKIPAIFDVRVCTMTTAGRKQTTAVKATKRSVLGKGIGYPNRVSSLSIAGNERITRIFYGDRAQGEQRPWPGHAAKKQ